MPQFIRRLLASILLWIFLSVAMAAVVCDGGLDWTGLSPLLQRLLTATSCFVMAEIGVLIGVTSGNNLAQVPGVVRAISPWGSWVLPAIVMIFAVLALNSTLGSFVPSWIYRGPMVAAVTVSLPIGGILFVRWITPPVSAARLGT